MGVIFGICLVGTIWMVAIAIASAVKSLDRIATALEKLSREPL